MGWDGGEVGREGQDLWRGKHGDDVCHRVAPLAIHFLDDVACLDGAELVGRPIRNNNRHRRLARELGSSDVIAT